MGLFPKFMNTLELKQFGDIRSRRTRVTQSVSPEGGELTYIDPSSWTADQTINL